MIEKVNPKHPDGKDRYQKIKNNTEAYKEKLRYNRRWKSEQRYRATAKGVYSRMIETCRRKDYNLLISKEDFIKWYDGHEKICHYCGITRDEWLESSDVFAKRYKSMTIDRKIPGTDYTLDNIVFACFRCNAVKSHYFTYDEMKEIGNIIRRKRG